MKKYFVVLSVAAILGLLAGMLAFSTVSADPIIGKIIQVPVIKIDDDWETWIHIFNKSSAYTETGVVVFFWSDYSGLCPSNSPPASGHVCMKVPWNGVWTLKSAITAGSKSGIVFSVSAANFKDACDDADAYMVSGTHIEDWWADWATKYPGEELAVVVDRKGPNDFDTVVSSAYTGISEEMEGVDSPYKYFAPYMMKGYHNLDTIMYIQNSGKICTSVHIYYEEQGICAFVYDDHIEQIAPGETYSTTVPAEIVGPDGWLGSAYIEAVAPLGIIVDQTSLAPSADRGMLLSWRGQPYQPKEHGGEWDTTVYGDLIFREWGGWNASVQVQNLTEKGQSTFVTVDFRTESNDRILYLADFICPGGSQTFYLPVVHDFGVDKWGAVEIKSHDQVDPPGGTHEGAPIFAIIDLKNATTGQGGAYNAHPKFEKLDAWDLSLPLLAKKHQNVTSLFVLRNNSNCAKINPEIKFKNEEGQVVCILQDLWLEPKYSQLFDLANIGCLIDGWVGAAEIQIREYEVICEDGEYVMPSAVVLNRVPPGVTALGDETRVYEAFPIEKYCIPQCFFDLESTVVSDEDGVATPEDRAPLVGATVTVTTTLWCDDTWTGETTTSADAGEEGEFSLPVPGWEAQGSPYWAWITVEKTGYLQETETLTTTAWVACDATSVIADVLMYKAASISGVVFVDKAPYDGLPGVDEEVSGATVELMKKGTTTVLASVTSDALGYKFDTVKADTYTVKATKGSFTGQFDITVTKSTAHTGYHIALN